MFFHSFVASRAREGRSESGSCEGPAAQDVEKICATPARDSDLEVRIVKKLAVSGHFWKLSSAKFAPRLRARAIWKSKSLKAGRLGALLEVELRKICTTPARESGLEVKIVKGWQARSTFGS